MVDAGEKATATLKREFAEEALNNKNGELMYRMLSDVIH